MQWELTQLMSEFLLCFHLSGIVLQNLLHDYQNLFAQCTRNSFLKWEYWKGNTKLMYISQSSVCRRDRKGIFQIKTSYHVRLIPHILLTVGHSATQRGCLYILTPVGGAASTLLSTEQRGRQSCKKTNDIMKLNLSDKQKPTREDSGPLRTIKIVNSQECSIFSDNCNELSVIQVAPAKAKWGSSRLIDHLRFLQKQFSRHQDNMY